MAHTTHGGRITGPVHYLGAGGEALIPLGPCLVEQFDARSVDISWGESGDKSAELSFQQFEAAEGSGHLVVFD